MRDQELELAQAKVNERVGEWIWALGQGHGARSLPGGVVSGFRLTLPTEADPMVLLIVKASGEKGQFIAFVGAPTATAALLAWRARERAGGMKWRVDKPWGESGRE